MYVCKYMYVCIYIYVCAYMCACICVFICIYMYTASSTLSNSSPPSLSFLFLLWMLSSIILWINLIHGQVEILSYLNCLALLLSMMLCNTSN